MWFSPTSRGRGMRLEPREGPAQLFEAREAVPAREVVDVRESSFHPAGERLVLRILLQRVEPDDAAREPREPGHLLGEEVGVADLEPVRADEDDCAAGEPAVAVFVEED